MPTKTSFLMTDLELLAANFEVVENAYPWKNKKWTPWYFVQQFFSLLWHLPKTDKIVIQFGGYWALLPIFLGKLFGVPSCIILHGTDCADMPSIGFGSLRLPFLRWSCKVAYKNTNLLVPVSTSLMSTVNTYIDKDQRQGVLQHFPEVKTPFHIIPNGLDIDFWTSQSTVNKTRNSFIAVFGAQQFELKGGPLIVEMAKRFPKFTFSIAGIESSELDIEIPKNLKLLGRLNRNELKEAYLQAQFHLQLSLFEGFGLALCEAMLCGCVPIGSSVNAIPEIIGQNGYILDKNDPNQLEELIKTITQADDLQEKATHAKSSIIERYSLAQRKAALKSTIEVLQ